MLRSLAAAALFALFATDAHPMGLVHAFQEDFPELRTCKLSPTGRNDYFILEPGHQLHYEGDGERLQITVLDETRVVDGIATRVVEEREWKGGKLYEVSRNYFAICPESRNVYYFGEHVEFYDDGGRVIRHDGSWLAGEKGNKAGLIMPGSPRPKMKYYQEIAPDVAMDRAEVVSVSETCKVPAGTFQRCLKIKETTPLERFASEHKYYAPGIGLIRDQDLQLVRHGFTHRK